jgi:hypothetical protein
MATTTMQARVGEIMQASLLAFDWDSRGLLVSLHLNLVCIGSWFIEDSISRSNAMTCISFCLGP